MIIAQEPLPLPLRKCDVGIAEERSEVVEGAPGTHPLEIDEDRLPIADHHVLRLEVAVDKRRRCFDQAAGQGGEFLFQGLVLRGGKIDPA